MLRQKPFVDTVIFNSFIGFLILMNAVVLGMETVAMFES